MKLMRFIGIHFKKNEDFLTTFKPILIIYSFLYLNVNVFKMWIKILVVFFFYFSDRIRKKPTFVYFIRYYFEEYIQHILRYAEVLTWLLYVDSLL